MGSFCDWVYDHRVQIIQHYLESPHESEPDDRWWLTTIAVKVITSPINIMVISSQGRKIILAEQMAKLDQLIVNLQNLTGSEGPHGNEIEGEDDNSILVGAFSITLVNVENYLKDLGVFALGKYNALAEQEGFDILQYNENIGRMICKILNGIYHSNPIRDKDNNPIYADPPACTPQVDLRTTP